MYNSLMSTLLAVFVAKLSRICVFQVHGANSANGIHHQESDGTQEVRIVSFCYFIVLLATHSF